MADERSESDLLGLAYSHSTALDAAVLPPNATQLYIELLSLAKSKHQKVKQLVGLIIPKAFGKIKTEFDNTINAMIDLCEDENREVRLVAVKGLPIIAIEAEHAQKVIEVLVQLMNTEDAWENEAIRSALKTVGGNHREFVIASLLRHAARADDVALGKSCLTFLTETVLKGGARLNETEEAALIDGVKHALTGPISTKDDKRAWIRLLRRNTKHFGGGKDSAGLIELITNPAALAPASHGVFPESQIDELAATIELARGVGSEAQTTLLALPRFFLEVVLPAIPNQQPAVAERLFKLLATVAPLATQFEGRKYLPEVYLAFKDALPRRPTAADAPAPQFNFTQMEPFLALIHTLGALSPSTIATISGHRTMAFTGQPSELKAADPQIKAEWDDRISYAAEAIKDYSEKLKLNANKLRAQHREIAEKVRVLGGAPNQAQKRTASEAAVPAAAAADADASKAKDDDAAAPADAKPLKFAPIIFESTATKTGTATEALTSESTPLAQKPALLAALQDLQNEDAQIKERLDTITKILPAVNSISSMLTMLKAEPPQLVLRPLLSWMPRPAPNAQNPLKIVKGQKAGGQQQQQQQQQQGGQKRKQVGNNNNQQGGNNNNNNNNNQQQKKQKQQQQQQQQQQGQKRQKTNNNNNNNNNNNGQAKQQQQQKRPKNNNTNSNVQQPKKQQQQQRGGNNNNNNNNRNQKQQRRN